MAVLRAAAGEVGRDGGIRTHGPLTPSQVRYQAALHPDVRFSMRPMGTRRGLQA
jgi:hypothetical protein